ncbi:metal-dependent transcriptional regulator [Vagococcus elongatus]|uniref:Manganese transport regulator n=1 Tax=Vagococcus elongatus TaxID=180344 RepID=A0A430ALZ3_9ENTE|nr:metal-dependent transcriptional regulator [Vagococcus elongatus]RSU09141.1 Cro/Cl family transcriptional regulator [Vagococcus elongatus]
MTPNKEDYLKLIYELGGYQKRISNKAIVTGLNVSPASVSEMVTKLEKDNVVTHTPYQGVQLTDSGMKYASSLIRKHRLWEVFLVEHLNYSWNEVHAEAEQLEHTTSDELTNRLEEFLNFPSTCPHGGIIPKIKEFVVEPSQTPLIDCQVGQKIQIKRVIDEIELLDYLANIGLTVDDIVTVEEISTYDGPILLKNEEGKTFIVSRKAAHNIFIKLID